ncbi:MAG: branched-chain alpha-keto acid dehydrogenase subunit [Chthonomonadales bacterium]|nr:branched-chain alpha-keto acid dehydrogenase subunit [Chthonomonadales bacterium]
MTTALLVPQLGEGLREVRLVKRLKSVGEFVAMDEVLYEVETEKAIVQVESSLAGTIVAWRFEEDDDVPVHGEIVEIEPQTSKSVRIPPRTRAFARTEGISPEELRKIPIYDRVLQIADVTEWQAAHSPHARDYQDVPLSPRQKDFNRRAFGDASIPISATIRRPLDWEIVTSVQERLHRHYPDLILSEFQILAYVIAQATQDNFRFRSKLLNRETLRRYDHLDMGFAIRLPGDELTTAVIRKADTLPFQALSAAITSGMKDAIRGREALPDAQTTLLLSSLAAYGVVDAIPVLIAPAAAVLFIGSPYPTPEGKRVNLVLTFDHRIVNGVGAAIFLEAIENELKRWEHRLS